MMKHKIMLAPLLLITMVSFAQKKSGKLNPTPANINYDSILFSKVSYREVGPFRGGRSSAVAGSYKNKNVFYFGAANGGVWKTMDGGSNWKNISDKFFGGSIGAVTVAPSDESILYVGEGEQTMRGNVTEGLGGMWRSDDAGRTWKNIGLKNTRHIVKIIVHPSNPNIAWVAAMGHLFGPSEDRGIYKTIDGGKTWNKVLYVNEQSGCSDIVMEPNNPSTLYAGTWHVIRTPYSMESGGVGSGLWKSTDGGETWTNISTKKGLPTGVWGIATITVAPSNTEKLYAMVENAKGGLFVSNDAGETWELQSNDNNIRQRAWYYSRVFVDPKNENIVYCPNVNFMRSKDGGKTFQAVNTTPHGDHHDVWIDPVDPNRMIVADDGGAQVSFDGAANFSSYFNQPTAQFYRVSTDNSFPYRILGAQQDNSTVRIKSRSYGAAITQDDWQQTAGAESGYVVASPANPDIVYGGNYGGFLSRLDHKTGENRAINVWPDNPMGAGADVQKFRFQWNFPIFVSPHNPNRLYAGGNHLFVTENDGQSWETISPDLTTNDKSKQASSGGPITKDNTSVEYYCTIFTATESDLEKDLLWTGSDDGLVHVSKDAGKHWDNVTPKDAPKWMMWNAIETDPFVKGKAIIVGTRYKLDDYTPYIYATENYGQTWKLITNGIPNGHFARVVRADKKRAGLLYAGTEYGMYISYDDGANWRKFQLNLPIVQIADLTIKENDLIVATHGRAFWVIDDLTPVQAYDKNVVDKKLFVYNVNDSYRMEGGGGRRRRSAKPANAGANPPNGVVINYWLKDANDSSKVAISIYDKNNALIKTFTKDAKEEGNKLEYAAGMNQFVWDMMYPPAEKIDGLILWNGNVEGPKVAPGKYTAKIKFDKDSVNFSFVIKGDPNYKMTEKDYDDQVGMLLKIRDKFSDVQKAIKQIRAIRTQINDFTSRVNLKNNKEVKQAADTINKQITTIEEALYQTKSKSGQDVLNFPIRLNDKIAGLYDVAASGYNPPSKQVIETYADLSAQADAQLAKLKKILSDDLVAFNKLIHEKQLPIIGLANEKADQ
jgi:photosystem II stability/assembly factor-like uncharacterized protein